MPVHVVKLPDVGEGVAEAEIVEWHVAEGDLVREDTVLAAVMTGKATVEIPSPVDGKVVWLGPAMGDVVPVGAPILKIEYADTEDLSPERDDEEASAAPEAGGMKAAAPAPKRLPSDKPSAPAPQPLHAAPASRAALSRPPARKAGEKPVASPAVRLRAREAGVDLRQVSGTGPAGRITHEDLEDFVSRGGQIPAQGALYEDRTVTDVKITGLRRRIAERMSLAVSRIPHITYVEEVDLTALEELRATMNRSPKPGRVKLTILPFLMLAIVKAVREQPAFNAVFDDEAGVLHQHGGVHIGIAAQTAAGLMVPVVRHAEARDIHDCAREILRLGEAARNGTALREELSGSTITISSLGALGGIVSTPVINHPEVAIIGVNKLAVRPHWDGTQFVPRKMMNLSSSFDHRVIDGHDAATFIQRIRGFLENPALIFVEA